MAATYEIGTPIEKTHLGDRGEVVPAYEIPYTSKKSGATGVIIIPKAMLSAEEVDRIVSAEVATLDAIAAL